MQKTLLALCLLFLSKESIASEKMIFSIDASPVAGGMVLITGEYEILASGEIDVDAAVRLHKFVQDKKITSAQVMLNSPGGSLLGGMRLGQMIRSLEFDTSIGRRNIQDRKRGPGVCASACAYAFAGGVNRYYSEFLGDRLGVHQFYAGEENTGDLGDAQVVSGLLIAYLQKMGVGASAFSVASTARGNEMVWLSPKDASSLGFANNGVLPATAEIKLAGQKPYLRLEQIHSDVVSRVILQCEAGRLVLVAGVVTTPELSVQKRDSAIRNYLEVDGREMWERKEADGIEVEGSVLWFQRTLSPVDVQQLRNANSLGSWIENGGSFRWGAFIELKNVQFKIREFVSNCVVDR